VTVWRDFEEAESELAAAARERLERTGLALLATLRANGSPRIDPVEPFFAKGHLLVGLLAWSPKARNLLRDPRFALHSAVSDPNGSEGELKVLGRAVEMAAPAVRDVPAAWWVERPEADARVFSLEPASVVLVDWDLETGRMRQRRWSPVGGVRDTSRPYP
jgi:Pyridoxamine 5'-phosphate oxidase